MFWKKLGTSSTAHGGGGSLKDRKPIGVVRVSHGWQSKSTDESKAAWNVGLSICLSTCLFDLPANKLTH